MLRTLLAPVVRPKQGNWKAFDSTQWQALALLAPALLIYAGFALYPLIDVFVLSFQQWNGLTPTREWVGLANYNYILNEDPVFWVAFRNTVIWTVLAVAIP